MLLKSEPKEFLLKINHGCDKKRTVIGISVLVFFAGILIHKAFFGTDTWDESFYLTIPYRVLLGDALFVDEWHVSQLSSFLQYLPLWLFVKITGSTEGIILFFRILFCLSQLLVSCFTFFKLKKYGFTAALLSATAFLLYVPQFVEALDYYTMSLMPLVILCMLLFTEERITVPGLVFSGVLIACAVVSEPILILLYLVYSVAVALTAVIRKRGKLTDCPELLKVHSWLIILAGILSVFIVFMWYVLSRESLSQLFANAFNVFRSNEYSAENIFRYGELFNCISGAFPLIFLPGLWLTAIPVSRKIIDGKAKKARKKKEIEAISATGYRVRILLALIGAVLALFYNCWQFADGIGISVLYLPFTGLFLSLGFFLLTEKKKYNFLAVWLVGFGYILCLATVSEALKYVGMYGAVISGLILFPSMFTLAEELSGVGFSYSGFKFNGKIYDVYRKILPVAVVLTVFIQTVICAGGFLAGDIIRMMLVNVTDSNASVCTEEFSGD